MKNALLSVLVLLAWGGYPLIAEDGKAEEENGSPTTGKKKSPGPTLPERPAPPPSPNLTVPSDLSEKSRKDLEEAILAFKEAEKAEKGQDRLLSKAIEKLRSASQKAFKSPLPLYYLGIAHQMKRNFPEARKVLEKAVKMNPRFHEALVELADVHVWQKDLKGSLAVYERALELSPSYTIGIERKAEALLRLGRFKEAKPYLEQVQKAHPSDRGKFISLMLEGELKGPGWEKTYTAETENYQVLTSHSQALADEIALHAELIRRAYDKVFSDIAKPERKFSIWVYDDAEAYHEAGGPRMAGGHYDPLFRKLVMFRYPKKEKTFLVLHHEAMHQYLHDYLEEAPQWFNEGLGDYFGAYEYVRQGTKEMMVPRVNRERLPAAQYAIDRKICPPASELMVMSQREMYSPSMMGFHYAQAWGMIYFMLEGKKPQYRSLLQSYFKALHGGKDTSEAYQATFGKIDMARFDKEWQGFIRHLGSGQN